MNSYFSALARAFGCLGLLVACACATSGERGMHRSGPITRAELDSVNAYRVDEALSLLRPVWLQQFSGACYEERAQNREQLSRLPLDQIEEIREITRAEATMTCGVGLSGQGRFLLIRRRQ